MKVMEKKPKFLSRLYAIEAHKDASNTYGERDYSYHLDMVFQAFVTYPVDKTDHLSMDFLSLKKEIFPDVIYLHDILQNTNVSENTLKENFSSVVADAVCYLTKPQGENRKERTLLHNINLSKLSIYVDAEYLALVVAVYERYANLKASNDDFDKKKVKMYVNEHEMFKKSVYRYGVADAIWKQLDALVAESVARLKLSESL